MEIANRIAKIEASKTMQVKELALQLKAKGHDVIDLTAGEPDFPTPSFVKQAGIDAINQNFTRYTANTGIPELRKAVVEKLRRDNQLEYTAEQIVVSSGAKQSLLNAMLAILNDADEVIFASPYWVSYPEQVKIAGGTPVIIDTTTTGFKILAADLQKAITPKTKAVIINSPCNPSSVVYSKAELQSLADVLLKHQVYVITDEIYEKILFDGLQHFSIITLAPELKERSILVNGLSKSHAMTGWRIGYSASSTAVAKAMAKIQGHYTSNACSVSQKAALAALTGPEDEITAMRDAFEKRRNFVMRELDQIPGLSYVKPEGAFYFFIKVSGLFGRSIDGKTIENSVDFSTYLIEKQFVVSVPGSGFGTDEYIRISFATSDEQLNKAMQRIEQAVKDLS